MSKPLPQIASFIERRRAATFAEAENAGLLGGARRPVGARVAEPLLQAAKQRSGLTSTTEVLEYALAKVALEDDFGERLLALKGTVPPDLDLEF